MSLPNMVNAGAGFNGVAMAAASCHPLTCPAPVDIVLGGR